MADAGAGRRITVRSLSCRGVKSFVPFQKPPLYAAVSLGGRREKTPADPDGGENPDWDGAVFAFDVDGSGEAGDGGLLQFEVKAQVPLLGTKLVGTTCVPLSHLGGDGGAPRSASYQVLAPDGKPNGSLSFVYAFTGGGAHQQPQIYGAPEQDLSSCCAPPPPMSSSAYPAPAATNFAPHGSSYPPPPTSSAYPAPATTSFAPHGDSYPPPPSPLPPVSSLYPSLHDVQPPSSYPPPGTTGSLFPSSNFGPNSSYPPPSAPATAYPPPPPSCTACPAPPAPPPCYYSHQPPCYYPPPPPSGYPPPARMNPEFPASSFPPPASSYPPPPESGSEFAVSQPRSVDRALPYMAPMFHDSAVTYPPAPSTGSYYPPPAPSTGSYYPPPETRHREEGASSPYYYPQPGTRYP
uniref:C2 domain-containing protein n=1 Tax=Hordeum vulgare subsp. vulgare TaxID=112509 RepID=A0A8I6XGW3_HORVV